MKKILQNLRDNWIKYGFETLAVTVGILGAFALENWKDKSLQKQELMEIYQTISDDLQSDILELDTLLPEFESASNMLKSILNEPLTNGDWVNNDSIVGSFVGYPDFLENQRGLNLLESRIAISGETGKLAGRIINFYDETLLKNNVTRGEYVKDNPNFRNRIFIYMGLLYSHTMHLKTYKEEGAMLMDEINAFLDGKPYVSD